MAEKKKAQTLVSIHGNEATQVFDYSKFKTAYDGWKNDCGISGEALKIKSSKSLLDLVSAHGDVQVARPYTDDPVDDGAGNVIELLENNEKAERIMEDLRGTQGPTVNFRYALYHIKNVSFVASRVSTSDAYYQPKVAKGISVLDVFLTGEETNVNDVEEILKKEYIKLERNN